MPRAYYHRGSIGFSFAVYCGLPYTACGGLFSATSGSLHPSVASVSRRAPSLLAQPCLQYRLYHFFPKHAACTGVAVNLQRFALLPQAPKAPIAEDLAPVPPAPEEVAAEKAAVVKAPMDGEIKVNAELAQEAVGVAQPPAY